ncbi:ROK family protein [Mycobacterium sp.]|uniref:ROK family protein n=1 Tax=Mycobacterium sp. TaxID=1785 RepID=UPI0031D04545
MLTLALDIGGTKVSAGLVDPVGTVVHSAKNPMPHTHDPERVWAAVEELITDVLTAAGGAVRGAGIAAAGPISIADGTVTPLNIPAWRGFPIVARVTAVLPGGPVRLAGDGVCMALGEHWRGAGRGSRFLLGIVVSTGVGGGLVLDGAPYQGRTGNAGHVGHLVVESGGVPCVCGGHGCVEAIASGPSLTRWARVNGWTGADAALLAAAAAAGQEVPVRAFERGATALAAMIASVGAVCDLDLVVVGGGVAKSGAVLFDPLRAALGGYACVEFIRGLRVVPAELGDDAGLIGAARLVSSRLPRQSRPLSP